MKIREELIEATYTTVCLKKSKRRITARQEENHVDERVYSLAPLTGCTHWLGQTYGPDFSTPFYAGQTTY